MEENVFFGIEKAEIKLPLDILREYEKQFNEAFGSSLVFQIASKLEDDNEDWAKLDPFNGIREPSEQKYVTRAFIVAPSLKNYRMLVMKVSYLRSKVYPCELFNALSDKTEDYETPETLDKAMREIFLSEDFKKPVRMLLSQIG